MNIGVNNARALALEWATAAGVEESAKLVFADTVAAYCSSHPQESDAINFGVHYNDNGDYYLHAITKNKVTIIDTIIPLHLRRELSPVRQNANPTVEQLLDNYKVLDQSNRDLKQFTFGIAHDLKNSLTKLKLAVALLEQEKLEPQVKRYVQIIDRAAQQLEEMTLRMNELIEIGHNRKGVVKAVALDKVFNEVHEEFQDSLGTVNASVAANFSIKQVPYVEVYLRSIFSNLISNSVKYASPVRDLRINVTARGEGEKVVIDFSDNGQGIDLSDERNQKIFDPFTRYSDKPDGKGLGLYIVKTMVERNGGHVQVESSPDNGTTFHFVLQPYKPD